MSPNGGADFLRSMEDCPLNPVSVEHAVSRENMRRAWKQVKANGGAPGIDGLTIEEFPLYAKANWEGIKTSLLDKSYNPCPVKRVEIPKDNGGTRNLGIPVVMDRVIQQAITQVLTPVFDPHFSESSFGFRPSRSAHQAVKKVLKDIHRGYRYAVDIDLEKFFDTVDHDILMNRVSRKVRDKGLLSLIGKYLRAGVIVNGRLNQTSKGVPQGGPLSPFLSNILLDDLDKELERRGHRFARYADDLIILVTSKRAGERVMESISRFLERVLKVKVNRDKSKVVRSEESPFLGFTFTRKRLTVSEKSTKRFKSELRRITGRSWGVSMGRRYGEVRTYLYGWMNYFGIALKYNDAVEMDHWLRRRIRMCYWKQWRRARKRIGELIKLGAPRHHAILTGLSRKGYWHLAKTLSTNCGLGNEFLERQGLTSIRSLWIGIHYPAKAR
ncbi:MAG: group II intron reverse transcriptase/maturase [Nitrospirae bacterium]|nr:group II intron reverse transcriptase/maturase [Nitrospirota bacterium]